MTAADLALEVIKRGQLVAQMKRTQGAKFILDIAAHTELTMTIGGAIAHVEFSGFAKRTKGEPQTEPMIVLRAAGPIAGAQVWFAQDNAFRPMVAALAARQLVYKPERFLD